MTQIKQLKEQRKILNNHYNTSGDYSVFSRLRVLDKRIDKLEGREVKPIVLQPTTRMQSHMTVADAIKVVYSPVLEVVR